MKLAIIWGNLPSKEMSVCIWQYCFQVYYVGFCAEKDTLKTAVYFQQYSIIFLVFHKIHFYSNLVWICWGFRFERFYCIPAILHNIDYIIFVQYYIHNIIFGVFLCVKNRYWQNWPVIFNWAHRNDLLSLGFYETFHSLVRFCALATRMKAQL